MSTSLGCWVCQTKKAVLFRDICLRAVCYSDTQGWLGFPWPLCLKRGWAKTCATLPWPIRGWSLQVFVLPPYAAKPMRRERVSRLPQAPSAARPGLDAGATRALHCVAFQGRQTAAARCRPGERLPSCAHPRGLPGHGKPSTASRSAAHSPASERPLDLPWERSDARGAWGHVATTRSTCHRQRLVRHACAPPVPQHAQGLRPRSASTDARLTRPRALAGGQPAVAVLLVRAARPGLDVGALRQYIAKPCKERGKTPEG